MKFYLIDSQYYNTLLACCFSRNALSVGRMSAHTSLHLVDMINFRISIQLGGALILVIVIKYSPTLSLFLRAYAR